MKCVLGSTLDKPIAAVAGVSLPALRRHFAYLASKAAQAQSGWMKSIVKIEPCHKFSIGFGSGL